MVNSGGSEDGDTVIRLLSASPCLMDFQPIIESHTKGIFGFEALFRGCDIRRKAAFEEILSQEGCCRKNWLRDVACMASALRQGSELAKHHRLFVNVRACTIGKLVENRHALFVFIKALGIEPSSVVLEIMEDDFLAGVPTLGDEIRELRSAGISIAIDNVMTDAKWLRYASWIIPSYLKIDLSESDSMPLQQVFSESICLLIRELGIRVIAMGVEGKDCFRVLDDFGLSLIQGLRLGRPQDAEAWSAAVTVRKQIAGSRRIEVIREKGGHDD